MPFSDAGAFPYPLVAGVDERLEPLVRHDPLRQDRAKAGDGGVSLRAHDPPSGRRWPPTSMGRGYRPGVVRDAPTLLAYAARLRCSPTPDRPSRAWSGVFLGERGRGLGRGG